MTCSGERRPAGNGLRGPSRAPAAHARAGTGHAPSGIHVLAPEMVARTTDPGARTEGVPRSLDHDAGEVVDGLRIAQVEALEGVDEGLADHQVAVPLPVGGHHDPGRVPGCGAPDRLLVGVLVVVPALPLLDVADPELPVLRGVVEAGPQPLGLLVLRDVQEALDDG